MDKEVDHKNTFTGWQKVGELFKHEACGGVLLIFATVTALILANSPLSGAYLSSLKQYMTVDVAGYALSKPILLWINDGLMAFFFLLIGLELKREFLNGHLSDKKQIVLPAVGAAGGLILPALIYTALNFSDSSAMQGWAIPAATDIAFVVGILALLGKRVPAPLKIFVLTLAILDDLAAILIIAIFYTADLSFTAMGMAALCIIILIMLNFWNVKRLSLYFVVGVCLWVFVLKSGVHATLAGVILAFAIPYKVGKKEMLHDLEHGLHPWVNFLILPVFALANAGIPLQGITWGHVFEPIPLGILLGLFLGKQFGIFTFSWLIIRLKLAKLPEGVRYLQLYGVSILAGIGFTMSLFIASLAFEHSGEDYIMTERIGILAGSLLSGVVGFIVLVMADKKKAKQLPSNESA